MEEGQFLTWKYKPQHGLIFHKFDQMVNGSNIGRSAFTLENQNQPNHPGVNSALFQGGSARHSVCQTLDTPTQIMCNDMSRRLTIGEIGSECKLIKKICLDTLAHLYQDVFLALSHCTVKSRPILHPSWYAVTWTLLFTWPAKSRFVKASIIFAPTS